MSVDFEKIWETVISHSVLSPYSFHGPTHWRRVEANGLHLCSKTEGSDLTVVRLFAVFHDSCRENEGHDPQHGQRGALLARELHGSLYTITSDQLELLCLACDTHHLGAMSEDPTVGVCYDADRLDLGRVGILPDAKYMNSEEGRLMATEGIQLEHES